MNLTFRNAQPLTAAELQARIWLLEDLSKSHAATYHSIQQACRHVFLLDPTVIPCLNRSKNELLDYIDAAIAALRGLCQG